MRSRNKDHVCVLDFLHSTYTEVGRDRSGGGEKEKSGGFDEHDGRDGVVVVVRACELDEQVRIVSTNRKRPRRREVDHNFAKREERKDSDAGRRATFRENCSVLSVHCSSQEAPSDARVI